MVCSNCKHELNPLARVCPTCGTPVPGAPAVLVQPPASRNMQKPRKYISAARVFVVILCILAVALNVALITFWFLPSVGVVDDGSPASVTLFSLHNICRTTAPYLTYAIIAVCVVSALFCILPLFKSFADKRCVMLIPKIMTVFCAVSYVLPFIVYDANSSALKITDSGILSQLNPFAVLCVALFVLLYVIGGLTSRNRFLIQRHRIEMLEDQLTSYGIRPMDS